MPQVVAKLEHLVLLLFAGKNTTVYIGVNVKRVSGVDENKEVNANVYSC